MGGPAAIFGRILTAVIVAALVACAPPDEGPEATAGDAAATGLRIVSLSPAISRTLVDLGLEDRIVGRSPYCTFLDADVPVVGDLLNVDYERIVRLEPTHLLVQAPRDGADPRLLATAERYGWHVGTWTALDTIDDIERLLRDLPAVLAAPDGTDTSATVARAADLLNAMAVALAPAAGGDGAWRGPTLLVSQVDPVLAFGRATYLHEVLLRLGASNVVTSDGWLTLTLEDVARLDPPAIIIVRPDAHDADPVEAAAALARLDIDAARSGRIAVLAHPDALMPCSGIIEVAAEMRDALVALGDPAR
jgi:iron complex transport system substrate-binding protein